MLSQQHQSLSRHGTHKTLIIKLPDNKIRMRSSDFGLTDNRQAMDECFSTKKRMIEENVHQMTLFSF